jgi:hypothetical protein
LFFFTEESGKGVPDTETGEVISSVVRRVLLNCSLLEDAPSVDSLVASLVCSVESSAVSFTSSVVVDARFDIVVDTVAVVDNVDDDDDVVSAAAAVVFVVVVVSVFVGEFVVVVGSVVLSPIIVVVLVVVTASVVVSGLVRGWLIIENDGS